MRLVHTMIRVENLDESIDFYTQKIGLELVTKEDLPGNDATIAFLREPKSGHEIELTYNHDGRSYDLGDGYGHMAFDVVSVDDTYEEWKSRGVEFSLLPKTMQNGMRIAFAVDPTGYKLELREMPETA
ncbi:VOC family protein [Halomonas sp. ML-15]|uniref:VOC family protein n=1 Tax=Halomonas sp. ML-15 TaxID=2773305 RepID=UPI001746B320|nr:VOC family protein [Halomonas sp. ML-15]MBD3895721.1 VOC family protein [Halomonas sp. ML-15]